RQGLFLHRSTLYDWLGACADLLRPLFYLSKCWPLESLKRVADFPLGLFRVVPAAEKGVTELRTSGPVRLAAGGHRSGRRAIPSSTKRAQYTSQLVNAYHKAACPNPLGEASEYPTAPKDRAKCRRRGPNGDFEISISRSLLAIPSQSPPRLS